MPAHRVLLTGIGRRVASHVSVAAHRTSPLLPSVDGALFARAAIIWLSIVLPDYAWKAASAQPTGQAPAFAVLVFTKTAGFRHDSIPAGIAALKLLGDQHNFHVDASEDAAVFTAESLARYRLIIFLNTTGDILARGEQAAFERFIQRGGDLSASTPPRIPDMSGLGTVSSWGPTSRATPPSRRRPSEW